MKIAILFLAAFLSVVLANVPQLAGCMVKTNKNGKLDVTEIIYPVHNTALEESNPLFLRLKGCEFAELGYSSLISIQKKQMDDMLKEMDSVSALRCRCSSLFGLQLRILAEEEVHAQIQGTEPKAGAKDAAAAAAKAEAADATKGHQVHPACAKMGCTAFGRVHGADR
jgi:hypothetical protein